MNVIETDIPGVVVIEPRIFKDERGYFFEAFNEREFAEKVRPVHFVQDNESRSVKGVVRGLHFQKPPYAQSKLVRVVKGEVLDVAVDIRKGSPTFGKYVAVKLSADNHLQGFIPGTDLNIDVLEDSFASEAVAKLPKGAPVALYCRSGNRSKSAARILSSKGYSVIELGSGFNGWVSSGRKVSKPKTK